MDVDLIITDRWKPQEDNRESRMNALADIEPPATLGLDTSFQITTLTPALHIVALSGAAVGAGGS